MHKLKMTNSIKRELKENETFMHMYGSYILGVEYYIDHMEAQMKQGYCDDHNQVAWLFKDDAPMDEIVNFWCALNPPDN